MLKSFASWFKGSPKPAVPTLDPHDVQQLSAVFYPLVRQMAESNPDPRWKTMVVNFGKAAGRVLEGLKQIAGGHEMAAWNRVGEHAGIPVSQTQLTGLVKQLITLGRRYGLDAQVDEMVKQFLRIQHAG